MTGPVKAIKNGLVKAFVYSGRTSRVEFWWFAAFLVLACAVALVPVTLIEDEMISGGNRFLGDYHAMIWVTVLVFGIPTLLAAARRLHDIGWFGGLAVTPVAILAAGFFGSFAFSGLPGSPTYNGYASWPFAMLMLCLSLISFGGLLVALIMPSTPGPNKYGPNPREVPQ